MNRKQEKYTVDIYLKFKGCIAYITIIGNLKGN